MKTNELMIEDWVNKMESDHYIPVIIEGIYEDNVDYRFRTRRGNISIGGIEPIPITPEILEKNEFKKFPFFHINEQHQWSWWENTLISVTLWCRELNDDTKDGMMLKIEAPTSTLCIKVNYVHELQHALRLCGIEKEIIL